MEETSRPQADRTLVLMVDSRSPLEEDVYIAPYYSLSAAINLEYARRHGYSFHYYLLSGVGQSNETHLPRADQKRVNMDMCRNSVSMWRRLMYLWDVFFMRSRCFLSIPSTRLDKRLSKWEEKYCRYMNYMLPSNPMEELQNKQREQPGSVHFKWGPRAASWSKLLALDDVMAKGYNRIIYLDTDVIFNRPHANLDVFLTSSTSNLAPVEDAALMLTIDYPWAQAKANAGFMVWRNTGLAREILRNWWNVDAGEYHFRHDYEQHALNHHLLQDPAAGYGKHIAIIPAITLLERKKQYVRHVSTAHSRARIPRFRYGLKAFGINPRKYRGLIREIERGHLILFDTNEDRINVTSNNGGSSASSWRRPTGAGE